MYTEPDMNHLSFPNLKNSSETIRLNTIVFIAVKTDAAFDHGQSYTQRTLRNIRIKPLWAFAVFMVNHTVTEYSAISEESVSGLFNIFI